MKNSLLIFSVCVACVIAQRTVIAARRPDILMIAVDDLRPMLGCYGDARIKSPNIDRMARRSVLFERAYCQYAKCGTSRLSLMTGLRPDSIGVFSNRESDVKRFRKRRPDVKSLAKWLKQHGYDARSFGKIDHDGWHVNDDWSVAPFPGRPREMWEVVNPDKPTGPTLIAERLACPAIQAPDVKDNHLFAGRMTDRVIRALQTRDKSRPSFFAVGYRRPHLPFVAPKRYFDLYQPDRSWPAKNHLPPKESPVIAWFNSYGYIGSARKVGLTMPNPPNRQQAIDWNGYELRSYLGIPNNGPIDEPTQIKILRAYAACVSYVDAQIGRLFDELKRSGQLENTVVVFWSDHGWHLGEHSAWSKMTNYEIATRVPLFISAPGIKSGKTKAVSELVDLYPTICDLVGIPRPNHLEGETLMDVLRDSTRGNSEVALSQYARFRGKYMGRAVRNNRFRFVRWTELKTGKVVHRELFDHQSDPMETQNVAGLKRFKVDVQRLEGFLER